MKRVINSDVFKMITALACVGVISAVALVFVYNYSVPKIIENVNRATQEGIKNIFPKADKIKETSFAGVYEVKNKAGKDLGYAFTAEGNGYQGKIQLIAGVDKEFKTLSGMEVLESQETPGLGAEISGDFRKQFSGLSVSNGIEYVKNKKPEKPGQIEAITGATISSRAVVNMLNDRLRQLRENLD
ncbi:MAG: RnfABCDGE type electron transport complex subunit G [Candidatus Omnitrophota bacterium]